MNTYFVAQDILHAIGYIIHPALLIAVIWAINAMYKDSNYYRNKVARERRREYIKEKFHQEMLELSKNQ